MKVFYRTDFPATRSAFAHDFISGVTVAIVALPLAIGFGITSGLTAAAGISTAIVAGFISALLGGSRFQVSGPTGAMTVVLIPVIHHYGIGAIPTLGVMAGVIVIAMGALRLGRLIKRVPDSVVEGFTVGIAIIIALQQLPFALGVTKGAGDRTLPSAFNTVKSALALGLHWQTLFVLCLTLFIKFNIMRIVEAMHIRSYIPASFSALVIASGVTALLHLSVNKVGDIPRSVITWTPPHSNNLHFVSLIVPALSIAFLAAIESLLAARVADELAHVSKANEFRPNQELFGQGIASAIASIFGGMPATGAIARTNVNVRSHGTSRIASMVHALTLLIIILFMAPLFSQIPSAAIAGVLIGTSFRIFNKATMLEIFSSGREKTLIFLVTAISTVSIDLIWGISIGIALYWAFALKAKFL